MKKKINKNYAKNNKFCKKKLKKFLKVILKNNLKFKQ